MPIEQIQKGERYLCLKDYVIEDRIVLYRAGKEYISEQDDTLTDELGNSNYQWAEGPYGDFRKVFDQYFELVPKKVEKCKCIEQAQEQIIARLREDHPDRTYEDISLFGDTGFENVGLSLGENGGITISLPFKARFTFIKTNGSVSTEKTEKTSIRGAFCIFCGIKI